ncbi:MAG: 50S ribosomal protein L3 [Anaplasmataceae bacterium]|nr:50S ribosomal protein L3 [Anaplasmataceae bacterium]
MNYILGTKVKMSQIWRDDKIVPVTIVQALPNKVTSIRSKAKEGYEAVQVSLGKKKKEFRLMEGAAVKLGDEVTVSAFKEGDIVTISGYSKGRGFAGVVKRHGFGGGPQTHGQKNRLRAPGSIGSTAPQRVVPGRRMAGHMGTNRVTTKNLRVAAVDAEANLIMLRGAVPGAPGAIVEIRSAK